mmetsp:Transcript_8075/g.12194  ORF Transcript_8075/g.12194 Transcript_8075/m.12194 type:complete len:87 (+) Transcript_8075:567-827(+)
MEWSCADRTRSNDQIDGGLEGIHAAEGAGRLAGKSWYGHTGCVEELDGAKRRSICKWSLAAFGSALDMPLSHGSRSHPCQHQGRPC